MLTHFAAFRALRAPKTNVFRRFGALRAQKTHILKRSGATSRRRAGSGWGTAGGCVGGGRQAFGSRVVGGRLPGGQATLHIPFAGGWWVAEDRVGGGGTFYILFLLFSHNLQSPIAWGKNKIVAGTHRAGGGHPHRMITARRP